MLAVKTDENAWPGSTAGPPGQRGPSGGAFGSYRVYGPIQSIWLQYRHRPRFPSETRHEIRRRSEAPGVLPNRPRCSVPCSDELRCTLASELIGIPASPWRHIHVPDPRYDSPAHTELRYIEPTVSTRRLVESPVCYMLSIVRIRVPRADPGARCCSTSSAASPEQRPRP